MVNGAAFTYRAEKSSRSKALLFTPETHKKNRFNRR